MRYASYSKYASHALGLKPLHELGFTLYIGCLIIYFISIKSVCLAETLSEDSDISAKAIARWDIFYLYFLNQNRVVLRLIACQSH